MNTKKIINTAVAIFAITIFMLAAAPRLFAEPNITSENVAEVSNINLTTNTDAYITKVFSIGDSFPIEEYSIKIDTIEIETHNEGTRQVAEMTISRNNTILDSKKYRAGDMVFNAYLNTSVKIKNVYTSIVTISFRNTPINNFEVNENTEITYKLEIPCAIDRTKIIMPKRDNQDYTGPYKTMCNSSADFNSETGIYHLKKNEGYYLNLHITEDTIEKPDISQIDSVTLQFYNRTREKVCFTKQMTVDYKDNTLYHGKIGYVQPIDSKEYAIENMYGFIGACGGLNSQIYFKPIFVLKDGKEIISENVGIIKSLIVDSDNSNIDTEQARVRNQKAKNTTPLYQINDTKQQIPVSKIANKEIRSIEITNNNELFITKKDAVQKTIPINQMLEENEIDSKKIVGDINLETESETPFYVFEVKEKRILFGFIPFGNKIVEKRISAIKELKE